MPKSMLLMPLVLLAGSGVALLAGALLAHRLRTHTNYAPRVLAAMIAPWLAPAAAVGTFGPALAAVLLGAGVAATGIGAGAYVRSVWSRDDGVGEMGMRHRERDGIGVWLRDRYRPGWRTATGAPAGQLLNRDAGRCVLGPHVNRRGEPLPGAEPVSVRLGRVTPGDGPNFGVVGLLQGRPGSGKTTTAIRLLFATANADPLGSIAIVDPKGDKALRDAAKAIAERHGTQFWEWSAETPLDPLASSLADPELATQAAVARVMAAMEFTEPHYESIALQAYTDAADLIARAGEPLTLTTMAEVLSSRGASQLAARARARAKAGEITRESAEAIAEWIADQEASRAWGSFGGAAVRLHKLTRTGLGSQFAAAADGGRTLSEIASTPGVSYLYLDAGMWPDAAKQVAELLAVGLMQDVGRIAATHEHTITMFIDELSAVPATRLDAMLQRGRSAGFSVILATQTLAGIGAQAPELVSQITGTLSWCIGHSSIGQSEGGEDDAERIARLAGTRIELERTTQTSGGVLALPTGAGSQRQVDAYIVHPNLIRGLGRGQAVVIDVDEPTSSPARGRLCQVQPYEPPAPAPAARARRGPAVALDPARLPR